MAESDYFFVSGVPVPLGEPDTNDYLKVSGDLVSDIERDQYFQISGKGLKKGRAPPVESFGLWMRSGSAGQGDTWEVWVDSIRVNGTSIEGFEDGTTDDWRIREGGNPTSITADTTYAFNGNYSGKFSSLNKNTGIAGLAYKDSVAPLQRDDSFYFYQPDSMEFHAYYEESQGDDLQVGFATDWPTNGERLLIGNLNSETTNNIHIQGAGLDIDTGVSAQHNTWLKFRFFNLSWRAGEGEYELIDTSDNTVLDSGSFKEWNPQQYRDTNGASVSPSWENYGKNAEQTSYSTEHSHYGVGTTGARLVWKRESNVIGGEPYIVADENRNNIISGEEELICFDAETGSTEWSVALSSDGFSGVNGLALSHSEDLVYVADAENDLVRAYNLSDGSEDTSWGPIDLDGDFTNFTPLYDPNNNQVLIGGYKEYRAVDAATGNTVWSDSFNGEGEQAGACYDYDNDNYIAVYTPANEDDDEGIRAYDATTGNILYTADVIGSTTGHLTYYDNKVFFKNAEGTNIAIDSTTGNNVWADNDDETAGFLSCKPAVNPDRNEVYFPSNSNTWTSRIVMAYKPDGTFLWSSQDPDAFQSDAALSVGQNGYVYSTSSERDGLWGIDPETGFSTKTNENDIGGDTNIVLADGSVFYKGADIIGRVETELGVADNIRVYSDGSVINDGETWNFLLDDVSVEGSTEGFENGEDFVYSNTTYSDNINASISTTAHSGDNSAELTIDMVDTQFPKSMEHDLTLRRFLPTDLSFWVYIKSAVDDNCYIEFVGSLLRWNLRKPNTTTVQLFGENFEHTTNTTLPSDEWVQLSLNEMDWENGTGTWEIYSDQQGTLESGTLENLGWRPTR